MKRIVPVLMVLLCLILSGCAGKTVVKGFDGTPALNMKTVSEHIDRVELTVDNWQDYIKEYSYEVETVQRDAFDEIIAQETATVYRLGYGTDRYHCLSATIELKHKQTGEIITFGAGLPFNIVEDIDAARLEPFHLDEYECTRIKGYMYFIDYPQEVLDEVTDRYDRQDSLGDANGTIAVTGSSVEGSWDIDCDAKVIESNSDDWKKYFE